MERELNFQQNPYNTSHHTFSVLPHYLAKVKMQILANLSLYDFHSTGSVATEVLIATMSTMPIRYGASSSSKSISGGCATLMN